MGKNSTSLDNQSSQLIASDTEIDFDFFLYFTTFMKFKIYKDKVGSSYLFVQYLISFIKENEKVTFAPFKLSTAKIVLL
jgi:hypothetical protein